MIIKSRKYNRLRKMTAVLMTAIMCVSFYMPVLASAPASGSISTSDAFNTLLGNSTDYRIIDVVLSVNETSDSTSDNATGNISGNTTNNTADNKGDIQASVKLSVNDDCRVIVAIHDGSGVKMIASGVSDVAKGSIEVKVPIIFNKSVNKLPVMYFVRAYLIEKDSLSLLGSPYSNRTIMQTKGTISMGGQHSSALLSDGRLYMWGDNSYGQLGPKVTLAWHIPTMVMDNVASVSLGYNHSAAIMKDGSLYTWGNNEYGQLGNNSTENTNTPVKIMDDVAAISLDRYTGAAITRDGSLYMWGENYAGMLGDGTTTNSLVPIKIMDNVASVELAQNHSAAITTDGSLYMWGENRCGQLGDGTTVDSYTPIKIMDNVASVSVGGSNSAAITTDGALYIWGSNDKCQLTNGLGGISTVPLKIMDNISKVSLGYWHILALTNDGELYTWGYNRYGQFGTGERFLYNVSDVPVKVMDNVSDISAGFEHTGIITDDGYVHVAGWNFRGQTANGYQGHSYDTVSSFNKLFNIVATTEDTSKSVEYSSLVPNGEYLLYAMESKNSEDPLSPDNLLYIGYNIANLNGSVSFEYDYESDTETPDVFVVGPEKIDINEAYIIVNNLLYTGMEQEVIPIVYYDDVYLQKDVDYVLSGDCKVKYAIEYSITITGIGKYTGSVTKKFIVILGGAETPTEAPTESLTQAPTEEPTQAPTEEPTQAPTEAPTQAPTEPTQAPTEEPTQAPTEAPTQVPTEEPTQAPTEAPTEAPTQAPTEPPTEHPTEEESAPAEYKVKLSSILTNGSNIDTMLNGAGTYQKDDIVTISVSLNESDKDKYTFKGWYYKKADGTFGELASSNVEYRFKVRESVALVAIYSEIKPEEPEIDVNSNGIVLEDDGKYHFHVNGITDTSKNGLVLYEGIWYYFEQGIWIEDKYGFVDYDGSSFLVANGVVADITGLQLYNGMWYYLSNGQLHNNYTGLAMYDNEWFYVINGILASDFNGIQDYDGSKFLIAQGRILYSYSGLFQDTDGTWYYIANGQVQTQYTGLVQYDGRWFLVENGVMSSDYRGWVWYDGAKFYVLYGMVVE